MKFQKVVMHLMKQAAKQSKGKGKKPKDDDIEGLVADLAFGSEAAFKGATILDVDDGLVMFRTADGLLKARPAAVASIDFVEVAPAEPAQ